MDGVKNAGVPTVFRVSRRNEHWPYVVKWHDGARWRQWLTLDDDHDYESAVAFVRAQYPGARMDLPSIGLAPQSVRCPCGHLIACPIHFTALVAFCPRCRGKAGGSHRSKRKTAAVRRNAAKPRPKKPK